MTLGRPRDGVFRTDTDFALATATHTLLQPAVAPGTSRDTQNGLSAMHENVEGVDIRWTSGPVHA